MCFGWTDICRECGRIEYSIREYCDCLRRQERALLEESVQIARQHESKFAVKAFMQGERQTYLTDQEVLQRSRDVLMAYSRNERLHPFSEQHVARARGAIEAETEDLDIPIRVGLLNRFDDMVRRQSEIDATGRAITNADRINSYDSIQGQMEFDVAQAEIRTRREPFRLSRSPSREWPGLGMARSGPPRGSGMAPGPPRSPTPGRGPEGRQGIQRTHAPRGFNSFVFRYYQENPRPDNEDADLAPEAILLADAQNYIESLAAGADQFRTEHLDSFQELFFNTRSQDMRNFDFIPAPNPGGLVLTFRQWLGNQPERLALIQQQVDGSVYAWLQAIDLYATYITEELVPVPEHLEAFVSVRREPADSERQLYDEFRPSRLVRSRDSGDTPGRTGLPPVILSFQEWVRNEYANPTVRRPERIMEALEQDMDGYERYLRRTGTVSQLNLFRTLRTRVADTTFEFTPGVPPIPSLLDWRNRTNRRRREGEVEMSFTAIMGDYARQFFRHRRYNVPPEILLNWDTIETQYGEENRRQMYGYPRGLISPVVERLRQSRNVARDLVYASAECWPLSPANPVLHETRAVRSFLAGCIAAEHDPSPEQWRRIGGSMAHAQTIQREEDEWRNEEWVNERARNPVPRTPQTVDDDASTVTDSPPQRQQHGFPPPGVPNFPLDPYSDSDDDFPL